MSELDEIIAVKQAAEAELLGRPGVVGVDVGYKTAQGRMYPQWLAIRVFVEVKGDFNPEDSIPTEIGGFPTDVIEVGVVAATADTARYRPLEGSISCSANLPGYVATLGAVVRDRTSRAAMVLSASHAFAPNDTTTYAILQPSNGDGGVDPVDRVAATTTRRSRIAGASGIGGLVGRDCAAAVITIELDATNLITGIGPINGSSSAILGEVVKKRGRTSGLTFGVVTGVDATVTVAYSTAIPTTTYFHQISVAAAFPSTIFQDVGDSGALLLNGQNEAIGLLYASSSDHVSAWATPIQTIMDTLGVDFILEGLYENYSLLSWMNQLERPGAVLMASSEAGTMGVSNLLVPHLGTRWRTVGGGPAWFTCDIGASREIAVIGLFGTNFTESALWRVRLSNVGAGSPDIWDSGFVPANVPDGYRQTLLVLPSPVQARYVQIDFQDQGVEGGDGFFDIGAAWVGSVWQPSLNFALGYSDGWIDPSVATKSRGGQTYVDKRPKFRTKQFVFDLLADEELAMQAAEIDRLVGIGDNLLFIPEPFSAESINRQALLGRLLQLSPSQMVAFRSWQKSYFLEERL